MGLRKTPGSAPRPGPALISPPLHGDAEQTAMGWDAEGTLESSPEGTPSSAPRRAPTSSAVPRRKRCGCQGRGPTPAVFLTPVQTR